MNAVQKEGRWEPDVHKGHVRSCGVDVQTVSLRLSTNNMDARNKEKGSGNGM